MTRGEAKEFYPILQAFAEGRVIECRIKPSVLSKSWRDFNKWTEMKEIEFWNNREYRIKPEKKYRPFKDVKECWQELLKHQPFGWVKSCASKENMLISAVSFNFCVINGGNCGYDYSLNKFTFADGTPFGIKEEK